MKTLNKINQIFSSVKNTFPAAIATLSVIAFVGCTSDKSLEQYRQETSDKYVAQYSVAAGNYTGIGVSKQGNSTLGEIGMQVIVGTQTQSSSDGLGNEAKATLSGYLAYNGSQLPFSSAYYSPSTGSFNAICSTTDEAGNQQTVVVDGKIKSGNFTGSIYMSQYPDYGVSVSLSTNPDASVAKASLDAKSKRAKQLALDQSAYLGRTSYTDADGNSHDISLRMSISSPAGLKDEFLRMINAQRVVLVNLYIANYRADGTLSRYEPYFSSATKESSGPVVYLTDAGSSGGSAELTGQGQVTIGGSSSPSIKLSCVQQADSTGKIGWSCSMTSASTAYLSNVMLSPIN